MAVSNRSLFLHLFLLVQFVLTLVSFVRVLEFVLVYSNYMTPVDIAIDFLTYLGLVIELNCLLIPVSVDSKASLYIYLMQSLTKM